MACLTVVPPQCSYVEDQGRGYPCFRTATAIVSFGFYRDMVPSLHPYCDTHLYPVRRLGGDYWAWNEHAVAKA